MKAQFLVLFISLASLFPSALFAQQSSLQIHQFGLGDGDCALIIAIDSVRVGGFAPVKWDTATILVDAQRSNAGPALLGTVYAYLHDTLHRDKLDYVVVSHMHFDHYGGMLTVLNGLLEKNVEIGKAYDRTAFIDSTLIAPDVDDANDSTVCFDYDEIDPSVVRSTAGKKYLSFVKDSGYQEVLRIGHDLLYEKNFVNLSMTCVAAYGKTTTYDPKTHQYDAIPFIPESKVYSGYYKPKSENDLSFCFLLRFQGFHYFTGGDIGGFNVGNYSDGETPMASFFSARYGPNFHCCAMKVSHHGSAHSINDSFLSVVKPGIAIYPAALKTYGRSSNPLPTKDTYTRIKTAMGGQPNRYQLFTFIPKNESVVSAYYTKGPLANYNDVSIIINGLPGYGNINYIARFHQRKVKTFCYSSAPTFLRISCTQNHTFDR